MLETPFYNPELPYERNFSEGPFGAFADGKNFERSGGPTVDFLGHKLWQPFGIPAGPLINAAYVKAALAKGFDICVYKTVRTRQHSCHQWPNVLGVKDLSGDLTLEKASEQLVASTEYSEPLSITNSFGVPSMNPDWWQEDLATAAAASAKPGQLVIGGFQGTKPESGLVEDFIDDYVLAAKLVKEAGAPVLAANLSCPNEGTANLLCFDIDRVQKICEAIKNEIGNTPLLIKLAYFPDQNHLENLIGRIGRVVDGVIAINTIPAHIIDERGKQALPGAGRAVSGVCGASIKWAGLEMTQRLVELRQRLDCKYAVVGVGGVTTPADYLEYKHAGADAVLSATGAMWNPYLAQQIWEQQNN